MSKETNFFYGTGRRKTSAARVFLKPGKGVFQVKKNRKAGRKTSEKAKRSEAIDMAKYFQKQEQVQSALAPLKILNLSKSFDVLSTVSGGGFTGQAEAIRHGLARALLKVSPDYRDTLKKAGFLTRDSRMVERKKAGLHKARKSPQFSKR